MTMRVIYISFLCYYWRTQTHKEADTVVWLINCHSTTTIMTFILKEIKRDQQADEKRGETLWSQTQSDSGSQQHPQLNYEKPQVHTNLKTLAGRNKKIKTIHMKKESFFNFQVVANHFQFGVVPYSTKLKNIIIQFRHNFIYMFPPATWCSPTPRTFLPLFPHVLSQNIFPAVWQISEQKCIAQSTKKETFWACLYILCHVLMINYTKPLWNENLMKQFRVTHNSQHFGVSVYFANKIYTFVIYLHVFSHFLWLRALKMEIELWI